MKRDLKPLNVFAGIPRYATLPKKRSKARRGPLRDPKYRRWCTHQDCAVGAKWHPWPMGCKGRIDPAHTKNNGTSSKGPDSGCGPLCRKHHLEYDADKEGFQKRYDVDMPAVAAEHWERYQTEQAA